MARIAFIMQWYDQRPLRERILLLFCISVVVLYLTHLLILLPMEVKGRKARQEIEAQQVEQQEIAAQKMIVDSYKNLDPDQQNRMRLEILKRELEKLQEELQVGINKLVIPNHMPDLLKELLTRQEQLHLLLLRNQQPEPLLLTQAQQGDEQNRDSVQPILYRHPLHVKFRGDYITLLHYLRELEDLPRGMVWEEVHITTDVYPQATVELKVYTLSLVEGWIGG